MYKKYSSVEEQLFAHVDKNGPLPDQGNHHYLGLDRCWLWTASGWDGYGIIRVDGRNHKAHRISYQLFIGPIPDNIECMHKCDNRGCVNPSHLKLGTKHDNQKDSVSKGRRRHISGEGSPNSKLTREDIVYIRNSNESQRELARRFRVGSTTVWSARNGRSWISVNEAKALINEIKPKDSKTGRFIKRQVRR